MATFDGWEIGLYGSVEFSNAGPYDDSVLAHFRTKGSKNGVRRYQQPDGTWTPLGLRERKQREGWGKHERKAAKLERKLERRTARQERRAAFKERLVRAKAAYQERKSRHSLKNVSDADLQKRIDRLKLEREYKDLNRNPVLEAGKNLVKAYINHKNEKLRRATKAAELQVQKDKAKAELVNAQAARTNARNDLFDNVTHGAKRMKAKAELLKSKRQNTVRGAIGEAVGGIIKKEGRNIADSMKESLLLKAGRKIKGKVNEGRERMVNRLRDAYVQDHAGYIENHRYDNTNRDDANRTNRAFGRLQRQLARNERREAREIENLDSSVARNIARGERKFKRQRNQENKDRARQLRAEMREGERETAERARQIREDMRADQASNRQMNRERASALRAQMRAGEAARRTEVRQARALQKEERRASAISAKNDRKLRYSDMARDTAIRTAENRRDFDSAVQLRRAQENLNEMNRRIAQIESSPSYPKHRRRRG